MIPTARVVESSAARILVVEDEGLIALDLRERLGNLHYQVSGVACSGEEAIRMAATDLPDLVLMDIRLDGPMDGIEAASRIRNALRLPVIYVTSHTDEVTLERVKQTEPQGYIVKPFTDQELHTCIEIARYRHAAESRMLEQREWLDSVLRSIADAVVATDEVGRIRFLNPVAERLTGWSEAEARGLALGEVVQLIDPESRLPVLPAARPQDLPATAIGTRFLLRGRNGVEYCVEGSTAPIAAGQPLGGGIFVFRDVTGREQVEQQLQQARRMESLGRLAGGIAHEFNNLLTIVLGVSSAGITDCSPHDPQLGRFGLIAQAAEKAGILTRKLLALGRKQVLSPRILDVNVLLNDMHRMMRTVLRESVGLEIVCEAKHSFVMVDRQQLEDAILSIFLNARDAVSDGGLVQFRTANVRMPGTAPGVEGKDSVSIAITDSGRGMSTELISRIFEPFFTTKVESHGSGLGLASAHGFICQSGGSIDVKSSPGDGSSFTILLPAHEPASSPLLEAPRRHSTVHRPFHVLLVEDDDLIRNLEDEILSRSGMVVRNAVDGLDALNALRATPDEFDVVVADVVMPKLSGVEFARRALAIRPDLRVLFVSGYAEDQVQLSAFPPGTAAFLQKPFTPVVLAQSVTALMGDGTFPHSAGAPEV